MGICRSYFWNIQENQSRAFYWKSSYGMFHSSSIDFYPVCLQYFLSGFLPKVFVLKIIQENISSSVLLKHLRRLCWNFSIGFLMISPEFPSILRDVFRNSFRNLSRRLSRDFTWRFSYDSPSEPFLIYRSSCWVSPYFGTFGRTTFRRMTFARTTFGRKHI